jgi:hypothetical protein
LFHTYDKYDYSLPDDDDDGDNDDGYCKIFIHIYIRKYMNKSISIYIYIYIHVHTNKYIYIYDDDEEDNIFMYICVHELFICCIYMTSRYSRPILKWGGVVFSLLGWTFKGIVSHI